MKPIRKLFCSLLLLPFCLSVAPAKPVHAHKHASKPVLAPAQVNKDEQTEARLIEIYWLIGQGQTAKALQKAALLVRDVPTFALAQLVYADLLSARIRPVNSFGDVPDKPSKTGEANLADLQSESRMRLKALRERPAQDALPAPFLQLSASTEHAIAIDASKSRLYLFENRQHGLVLRNDYYISVGKLGLEKMLEGDSRTPLGIYYITSRLSRKSLKDYYGVGALPLSYPNALDIKRGKTGGGIWLHGTPAEQFSRAPLASDGCVVLTNPDMEHLLQTVRVGSTPVVIARQLEWLKPAQAQQQVRLFEQRLASWLRAKNQGNWNALTAFYAADFNSQGKTLIDYLPKLRQDFERSQGRTSMLKDVSLLHWKDNDDSMIVTFGEVAAGRRSGITRRQYWSRTGQQWQIFYEGVIG